MPVAKFGTFGSVSFHAERGCDEVLFKGGTAYACVMILRFRAMRWHVYEMARDVSEQCDGMYACMHASVYVCMYACMRVCVIGFEAFLRLRA